jgi:hypothetical protein
MSQVDFYLYRISTMSSGRDEALAAIRQLIYVTQLEDQIVKVFLLGLRCNLRHRSRFLTGRRLRRPLLLCVAGQQK